MLDLTSSGHPEEVKTSYLISSPSSSVNVPANK